MPGRIFALCALATIAALLVVGMASDGIVRHLIQTAPLWIVVALGLRGSPLAKWAALPIFLVWLAIMALIWLFLLNLARIVTGRFSPIEIAMTLVVGAASLVVVAGFWRTRTGVSLPAAAAVLLVAAALQVGAVALSLQAPLSSDSALLAWMQSPR